MEKKLTSEESDTELSEKAQHLQTVLVAKEASEPLTNSTDAVMLRGDAAQHQTFQLVVAMRPLLHLMRPGDYLTHTFSYDIMTVSYTHLTLPTILLV